VLRSTDQELARHGARLGRLPWVRLPGCVAGAVTVARGLDAGVDGVLGTALAGTAGCAVFVLLSVLTRVLRADELAGLAARARRRGR